MIEKPPPSGPDSRTVPGQRVLLGEAFAALARQAELTGDDIAVIERARDRTPARPMAFH